MAQTATLATVQSWNTKKAGFPWACEVIDGENVFYNRVFNGTPSKGGEIVLDDLEVGHIYGCGQKDYRTYRTGYTHTVTYYAKWDGTRFIPCDREGNEIDDVDYREGIEVVTDVQCEMPEEPAAEIAADETAENDTMTTASVDDVAQICVDTMDGRIIGGLSIRDARAVFGRMFRPTLVLFRERDFLDRTQRDFVPYTGRMAADVRPQMDRWSASERWSLIGGLIWNPTDDGHGYLQRLTADDIAQGRYTMPERLTAC